LAQRGLQVLVVERGDFLKPDPRAALGTIGKCLYTFTKNFNNPVSCVGGQTKFYGAALYRLRQSDFEEVEHECGISPAWPLRYCDLEPYYDQAEALYRVHGSSEGDPTDPPRSAPYPHEPIPHDPIVARMIERLERTGTTTCSTPRGLDYGPGGRCVLCSTCDVHYCQIDAKMDAEIAALRPALATGRVQLVTRTDCQRVLTSADGTRVRGVILQQAGISYTVHANTVAVCAGFPRTASLLRRSRNRHHPEGLGNSTGCLGRYMGGHSVGYAFPLMAWRKLPAIHSKTVGINTYYHGTRDWPYPLGVIQLAGQIPFWEMASKTMRPIARFVGAHSLMCFYMTEALPTRETGLVFTGDEITNRAAPIHNSASFAKLRRLTIDAFRRAGYRVLSRERAPYTWHEVGTARFGADPTTSVADPNCQVHGIAGLYVIDQSVLPSAGAVNTCLTIIALALRAGDHIAGGRYAAERDIISNAAAALLRHQLA